METRSEYHRMMNCIVTEKGVEMEGSMRVLHASHLCNDHREKEVEVESKIYEKWEVETEDESSEYGNRTLLRENRSDHKNKKYNENEKEMDDAHDMRWVERENGNWSGNDRNHHTAA